MIGSLVDTAVVELLSVVTSVLKLDGVSVKVLEVCGKVVTVGLGGVVTEDDCVKGSSRLVLLEMPALVLVKVEVAF